MEGEPRDPLADLLRTPVPTGRSSRTRRPTASASDRPPSGNPSWVILAGMALGIVAVLAGYVLAAGDGSDPDSDVTTTTTTTAPAAAAAFPDGYTAVSDLVAVHPEAVVSTPDRIMVGFTTAVRRGFDPDLSTPFQGGDFTLLYDDGTFSTAEQIVFDARAPGAFTVAFPAVPGGAGRPAQITLTSTWSLRSASASVAVEAETVPFALPAPLQVVMDDGSVVAIDTLGFETTGGDGTWSLPPGGDGAVGTVSLVVTVQPTDGDPWFLYTPDRASRFSGAAVPGAATTAGAFTLDTDGPDGSQVATLLEGVTLDVAVDFVDATPAQVTFDLTAVPALGG